MARAHLCPGCAGECACAGPAAGDPCQHCGESWRPQGGGLWLHTTGGPLPEGATLRLPHTGWVRWVVRDRADGARETFAYPGDVAMSAGTRELLELLGYYALDEATETLRWHPAPAARA
jgi:hypothetical protein